MKSPAFYDELLLQAAGLPQPDNVLTPLLRQLQALPAPLLGSTPAYFLIDYTSNRFLYLDPTIKRILGYDARFFIELGPAASTYLIHPDDRDILYNTLLPEFVEFVQQQPEKERPRYAHSYNYRFKTPDGEWITLLHRCCFPAFRGATPLAVLGYFLDITAFKEDHRIIHTIEASGGLLRNISPKPLSRKVHMPGNRKSLLTKRETEILQLMETGKSSKEIAAYYSVSLNTVHNHRRNMLEKTGTSNASELLSYARKHGLL